MNDGDIDLCPHPDDPLMAGAWADALSWHIEQPDVRAAFERDTKRAPFRPPKNGLERMIDAVCGYDGGKEYVRAFIVWFNERVWGDPYAEDDEQMEG